MPKKLEIAQVVKSMKGRDADKYFAVRSLEGDDFCLIVDGRTHKQAAPKRKRIKHLEPLTEILVTVRDKWASGAKVFDSEISSALKEFNLKSKGETHGEKR